MRVLTVRQPWAWAIVHGGKDVENRTRSLGPYRGTVAVHVSQRPMPPGEPWSIASAAGMDTDRYTGDDLHLGHVLGVVDLVDVHQHSSRVGCWRRADVLGWVPADGSNAADDGWEPRHCSPWAMPDHHHLVLANPRPLAAPIPARGRLGLWRPDDALAAAIDQQLALVGTDPLVVAPSATSPDCRAGKCRACSGDAWDDERDVLVPCSHDCHGSAS